MERWGFDRIIILELADLIQWRPKTESSMPMENQYR